MAMSVSEGVHKGMWPWRSREWCCSQFQRAFENRATDGTFVFVCPPFPQLTRLPSFHMGLRKTTGADGEMLLLSVGLPEHLKLTFSTHVPIHHCPWCGRRLAWFYLRRAEGMIDKKRCKDMGLIVEGQPSKGTATVA